jgi:MFS family permease
MGFQLVGEVGYIFARDYLSFAIIAVVAGIGFTFSSGCVEALVYDTLKAQGREKDMQKAMGRVDSAGRLGAMLGAAASALVVSTLTLDKFVLAIVLTAAAVGIGFVLSFTLEEPQDGELDESENSWLLLKDGVRLLAGNRNLQRIALLSLLTLPFEGYMSSLFQPYYVNAGVATPWFGLSAALGAFLAFLGSRYAYLLEKRFGVRLGTLLATISPGLLYLAMAALVHPLFSVVLYCTFQGVTGLRKPIFADYLNRHIESKNRATMLSFINMFSGIYVALIGLLIGWISDRSLMGAFVFMGVILFASSLFLQIDERSLEYIRQT